MQGDSRLPELTGATLLIAPRSVSAGARRFVSAGGGTRSSGISQRLVRGWVSRASIDKVTTGSYSGPMKAVGIKVLKAKLSEYIRLAKAGETILVTERDEVVAELGPARRQPLPADTVDERLRQLAERGEVALCSRSVSAWNGFSVPPRAELVSPRILNALRDEER